jgi:hypothetical protein
MGMLIVIIPMDRLSLV